MAQSYTPEQVLLDLRRRIAGSTQADVARSLGFAPAFICDVTMGRRDLTDRLARALGYDRQPDRYVKVSK